MILITRRGVLFEGHHQLQIEVQWNLCHLDLQLLLVECLESVEKSFLSRLPLMMKQGQGSAQSMPHVATIQLPNEEADCQASVQSRYRIPFRSPVAAAKDPGA